MFKKGDRVIYSGDPRKLRGTVIEPEDTNAWYVGGVLVEFDDWSLIPRRMKIPTASLQLIDEYGSMDRASLAGCECGLKHVREGGLHSTWCRLYKK